MTRQALDPLPAGLSLALFLMLVSFALWHRSVCRKLPPGPASFPVVGNMMSFPRREKAQRARELAGIYGEITYFHGLGQSILILNNRRAVSEFLVRRCDITGGRPTMTMAGELAGFDGSIILRQPGKEFREMRKNMSGAVGKSGASNFNKLLRPHDLGVYLSKVLRTPNQFFKHNRWLFGTYIMSVAYGYRPTEHNDPFITAAERAMFEFIGLAEPGTWIIDIFPFLKHILPKIPFGGYKESIARFRESTKALSVTPFQMVKQAIRTQEGAIASESFCASLIQQMSPNATQADEYFAAWTVGNVYAGGSDTTISSFCSFYLAMCLHPVVKQKAQAEVDLFTERMNRFPNANESDQFPYLCALISELHRWAVIAPMGAAHMSLEDMEYHGHIIPKNTTILFNSWAISQDPELYPNPSEFRPERFLGSNPQLDPREFAFGGGRRICPGMDLADTMMFLALSGCLATLEITSFPDRPPGHAWTDRFARHPVPFECNITLRSSKAQEWIDAALADG